MTDVKARLCGVPTLPFKFVSLHRPWTSTSRSEVENPKSRLPFAFLGHRTASTHGLTFASTRPQ